MAPLRQRRTILLGAAALAAAAALAWPQLREWQRERELTRAFEADLQRMALEVMDKRTAARGGFDERAAEHWRFQRIHQLLRKHRHADAPRFRKRINLLLGVYDRTAQQAARSNRAAQLTLQVQLVTLADVQDPVRTRALLDLVAEARAFATGFRAEVEASREFSRRAVARSGLPRDQRAEVWDTAERYYVMMQPSIAGAERMVPVLDRLDAILRFLERHHGRYTVYPSGEMEFTDPNAGREWVLLLRKRWE